MNCHRIYDQIIAKYERWEPPESVYYEVHHIFPRCLGGGNEASNLIKLPARVHFLVHLLLARMHGGKLIDAAWRMSNSGRYSSREYGWLRSGFAQQLASRMRGNAYGKGKKRTKAQREAQSHRQLGHKYNLGVKPTPEHIANRVQSFLNNPCKKVGKFKRTAEHTAKAIEARRRNGNDRHSAETRSKMRAAWVRRRQRNMSLDSPTDTTNTSLAAKAPVISSLIDEMENLAPSA